MISLRARGERLRFAPGRRVEFANELLLDPWPSERANDQIDNESSLSWPEPIDSTPAKWLSRTSAAGPNDSNHWEKLLATWASLSLEL